MSTTEITFTDPSDFSPEEAMRIAREKAIPNDTTSIFPGKTGVVSTVNAVEFEKMPVDSLPEVVASFISEGADAIGCDTSMIALPLLSALGATIGTSRRVMLKADWLEPPLVWSCVLGESGSSKTPAFNYALTPFRKIEHMFMQHNEATRERFEIDRLIYDKELTAWKKQKSSSEPPTPPNTPAQKRLIVNNTTMEALGPLMRDNPKGFWWLSMNLAGGLVALISTLALRGQTLDTGSPCSVVILLPSTE